MYSETRVIAQLGCLKNIILEGINKPIYIYIYIYINKEHHHQSGHGGEQMKNEC